MNKHLYKIYDAETDELIAEEDDLTTVRRMARLSKDEVSRLFVRGRVRNSHFVIRLYR